MNTPRTIFYLSPNLRSMLRIPRIKNSVDRIYPTTRRAICAISILIKHKAVIGKKTLMLYPYTHMTLII